MARFSQPSPVARQLLSPMELTPGVGALKSRRIRFGTATALVSGLVRFRRVRRVIPKMSFFRINRVTTRQPTAMPWRCRSHG